MTARLVLAGLGHAHLFVLEALARGRFEDIEVVLCTGETAHVYSGMLPGWLAGRYPREALTLDVTRLCERAGARHVAHHVQALDAPARTVTLANGETLSWDVCSLAVGSQPAALEVPGVRAHAVSLKPMLQTGTLPARLDALVARGGGAIVVVGAGLAGLEVALALRARMRAAGITPDRAPITVLDAAFTLIPDRAPALARRLRRACARHAITLQLGVRVREVEAAVVHTEHGEAISSDLTLWATGPAAPAWLAQSGLPVDARGFLLVDDALRSTGASHVFAAGDVATLASAPDTPRSGVYAVRMGPVLASNLAAVARRTSDVVSFRPQRHALVLVNTGDGRAIASRGRWALEGAWAMWWKDAVDRAFMARWRRV